MNNNELLLRQHRLLLRSARLRLTLADQSQVFKKPLALADQARNSLQWLYRNHRKGQGLNRQDCCWR
jgi:hypothetical protein